MYVQLKDPGDNEKLLALKHTANEYPGIHEIILVLGENNAKTALRMPFTVENCEALTKKLQDIFEPECVAVKL